MKTPTEKQERWAFKVYAGNYISEEDLEGLGISADWHLYLSPTEPPSAAECNQLMNAYELSSCPCCGGRATIIGTLKTCEWSAICTMCGLETAHMMQPKDAASAWNRRYAPDTAGDDFAALSDAAKDRIGIPYPTHPAPQQPAACRCVDCGGDQPRHDAGCLYMRELHGEQPADKPDQPGAKVRGLVEKWEQEAGRIGLSKWADGYITAMKRCLGELKAALSAKGENEDTTHER